jgi:hypothetical protein
VSSTRAPVPPGTTSGSTADREPRNCLGADNGGDRIVPKDHNMPEPVVPRELTVRLARARSLHAQLHSQLARDLVAPGLDSDARVAMDQMLELSRVQQQEIDSLQSELGIESAGAADDDDTAEDAEIARRSSEALERHANIVAALVRAYGGLYATGRLLYATDLCDGLAYGHALAWRDRLDELDDLLPALAIRELVGDGSTCQCICPACGAGACLCVRNSIETVREHRHRDGLEESEGIELRIPPRPGSQLAAAGLDAGDVVGAIDGVVVGSSGALQRALRRRPMGEPATARVIRRGSPAEIPLARVSDLPD